MADISGLTAALADRYRIERELGIGGMATVYLARDLKHDRDVAVKVLKPELAAVLGADRFVVEIKTTAGLQHPHILPLFDSGTASGFLFYVMPYVAGETVRDKLNRETQFGVDDAVRIAHEVADALDYAHRHGVIHRDIKPENILLHDGRAMVMDFGIALAVSAAAGGRMTETGLSLGTPHYMSPEQATAEKEITPRTDVYSLASVLYEMLTGDPPFTASSGQAVIMKIITEAPALVSVRRKSVPPNVVAAVAKALEKLPADRFENAKAFGDALTNAHFSDATAARAVAGAGAGSPRGLTIILGAALALMTIVTGWALTRSKPTPPSRYALAFAADQEPDQNGFALATSDGSRIVYRGPSITNGLSQLWIKERNAVAAKPMAYTAAPTAAAISPDDGSIAFVQAASLWRVGITGGAPIKIAMNVSNAFGSVAWLDDHTIIYAALEPSRLVRISENGGPETVVWKSDSLTASNLSALPGGRGVLFHACLSPCSEGNVIALDLRTGVTRLVVPGAKAAYYLPMGQLVTVEADQTVRVTDFDLTSLTAKGQAEIVLDSVFSNGGPGSYFSISANGTILARRGSAIGQGRFTLTWMDRSGKQTDVDTAFTFHVTQFAGNVGWSLSPDGTRLAIGLNSDGSDDIYIKALPHGPASRITFGAGSKTRPRWTADGRSVTSLTANGVLLRRADGTGTDSVLWRGQFDEAQISPDGKWLVVRRGARNATSGGRDILGARLGVDTALVPVVMTRFDENAFSISPDGHWIAYQSDESGRIEVFVRPFPNTNDAKFPVSTGGGFSPLWAKNGRELYFVSRHAMMSAIVTGAPTHPLGEPHALFSTEMTGLENGWYTPWDVAADGRFIMIRRADSQREANLPLIVIENWMHQLRAK